MPRTDDMSRAEEVRQVKGMMPNGARQDYNTLKLIRYVRIVRPRERQCLQLWYTTRWRLKTEARD